MPALTTSVYAEVRPVPASSPGVVDAADACAASGCSGAVAPCARAGSTAAASDGGAVARSGAEATAGAFKRLADAAAKASAAAVPAAAEAGPTPAAITSNISAALSPSPRRIASFSASTAVTINTRGTRDAVGTFICSVSFNAELSSFIQVFSLVKC
ncbi:hypothetical protein J2T19_003185 [Paenibacillus tundrae]|uniref:Uncharacterized protein n=1 Tax=Paenibacillus tundrae TaxID=528187 RepID=A0ABT9WEN7_9BACL|nr:hypothetical protein [Paenibacillus tundrae]